MGSKFAGKVTGKIFKWWAVNLQGKLLAKFQMVGSKFTGTVAGKVSNGGQ